MSFTTTPYQKTQLIFKPVFRTHDILVWIRIRICRSMPVTNGSGSGFCYFRHRPLRCQPKTNFLKQFFCSLLFEGTFTLSQKESQNSRIPDFFYCCMMIEGSGSIPVTSGSGSGRAKNTRIRIRIWNTASNRGVNVPNVKS
jgi:hypothetical protein